MGIIWALARNTIIQALRMRAALVLIVLFFIAAPVLLFNVGEDNADDVRTPRLLRIEADGTQEGEVKLLLTYSVTIASILLIVLTILLSASVLDVEIVKKYAFLICSKPVRRWQIMVGKWLGIVLLNTALLFIMGILILCEVWYFSRTDPAFPEGREKLMAKVLTSRISIRPDTLDVQKEYEKLRLELLKEGVKNENIDKQLLQPQIKNYFEECTTEVPPMGVQSFTLKGVPIAENPEETFYTFRYKLYSAKATDLPLYGRWRFVKKTEKKYGEVYSRSKESEIEEFPIPASLVDDNGEIFVEFQNLTIGNPDDPNPKNRIPHTVTFSLTKGVELLAYKESGLGNFLKSLSSAGVVRDLAEVLPFIINFFKALLLLLIRLMMIAAIGVAATSLVHFPVAILVLLLVVFLGSTRDVYANILVQTIRREKAEPTPEFEAGEIAKDTAISLYNEVGKPAWKFILKVITKVPPRFEDTNPIPDFTVGREISWSRVMAQVFMDLILRGGIVFGLGIFLFYRREIGRPEL
ncbi:MAG: hypothetical protein JXA52_03135 [Planctomycetes bacterium]|nr:hypothetical protein [Planctomycetota bacterium]